MDDLRRRQLKVVPFPIVLRKALRHVWSPVVRRWQRYRTTRCQPYATARDVPWAVHQSIVQHLAAPAADHLGIWSSTLQQIAARCLEGKLPVLGLGWIMPVHGFEAPGFGKYRYDAPTVEITERGQWLAHLLPHNAVPRSQWLWNTIDQPHVPYDWQRDFRSGYRWSERCWHAQLALDGPPGADPKVPWELGRLQLLPLLALAHLSASLESERRTIIHVIETILLDFAAQNPPGYGIQWAVSMEVALRLVAIISTLDLVVSHGIREHVAETMLLYLYDHACFVLEHLEWSEGMRGNHYLACIAGLSVAAAYFPQCEWTSRLRTWCAEQLCREARFQFLSDGGNFEASLAYHRFGAEMLAWATWYLQRTPEGRLVLDRDRGFWSLLERIADFTEQTTYESGIAPQIGDNDTGRFLSFITMTESAECYNAWYADPEPYLSQRNHRETCALLRAVCNREDRILDAIISNVCQQRSPRYHAHEYGLAILRNEYAEAFLRAGSIGQRGKGGHAHNDQLSITFALGGQEVLVDPGTGVYVASPDMRNQFRSTKMHNTLTIECAEQNSWCDGRSEALFWLTSDRAAASIIASGDNMLVAEHTAWTIPHRRIVRLESNTLIIEDFFADWNAALIRFHLHPCVLVSLFSDTVQICTREYLITCTTDALGITLEESLYSHSYGVWKPSHAIVIKPRATSTEVVFRWKVRS